MPSSFKGCHSGLSSSISLFLLHSSINILCSVPLLLLSGSSNLFPTYPLSLLHTCPKHLSLASLTLPRNHPNLSCLIDIINKSHHLQASPPLLYDKYDI